MKTHAKKRIDIMIEAPLMARMLSVLDAKGVTGYTVMPALAGKGKDGAWHRDGLAGRAGSVVLIYCILDETRVDEVLEAVYQLVSKQIGIVTLSDVQVVRPDHF
jgi:PII-like signaling protein